MSEPICNYRWDAPRFDVPTSVPVTHVCALKLNHEGLHACSCKRISLERRETPLAEAVMEDWDRTLGPWEERPQYNTAGALITACEVTWEAKRWCSAWGTRAGFHGCKYKPGHEGIHRCPCGSKHE